MVTTMGLLAWALLAARSGTRHVPLGSLASSARNVFFLRAGQRRPAMVMKYVIVAWVPDDA